VRTKGFLELLEALLYIAVLEIIHVQLQATIYWWCHCQVATMWTEVELGYKSEDICMIQTIAS